ncbi:MAG: T9SS type A sorting domain-containing protein [Ignavibacteriales bacterium]|nr:MAG: T9SS type A sorting domain-containing protein [Ignavibacteriales bacterium]
MMSKIPVFRGIMLFLFLSVCAFPQITKVPGLEIANLISSSAVITSNDGTVHFFFSDDVAGSVRSIGHKKMVNGVWQTGAEYLQTKEVVALDTVYGITAIKFPGGRIMVGWRTDYHYYAYSDNNGQTWSEPAQIPCGSSTLQKRSSLQGTFTITPGGNALYSYVRSGLIYMIISSDSGGTWSAEFPVGNVSLAGVASAVVAEYPAGTLICALTYSSAANPGMYRIRSTNGGMSWSDPVSYVSGFPFAARPKYHKGGGDTLSLFYETLSATPYPGIYQRDIYKIVSANGGIVFSSPVPVTRYKSDDRYFNLSYNGSHFSFLSNRDSSGKAIYIGPVKGNDEPAPPVLYNYFAYTEGGAAQNEFRVRVKADDSNLKSVQLRANKNGGAFEIMTLNDLGLFSDSIAGDYIYSHTIPGFVPGDLITWQIIVNDSTDLQVSSPVKTAYFAIGDFIRFDTLKAGLMTIPFDNTGSIADAGNTNPRAGWYDGKSFLFSAGFALSGKASGQVWANGEFTASRLEDYQSGIVGSDPADPRNSIFIIRSSDQPFGEAWQRYRFAVPNGAQFYDGDNDGIYNPVDLNSNNQWDANEDAPMIIGDYTAFAVFNDGRPAAQRLFSSQNPLGIQIAQTVFSKSLSTNGFNEVAFVRYTITNKSPYDALDDVYFSVMTDPDLGDYQDDLIGSDPTRDGGYVYNDGSDTQYGANPPAFMQSFVQWPFTYVPGVTYTDVNSNGMYDEGTDTPLDSLIVNYGSVIGRKSYRGAGFAPVRSFMQSISSHPTIGGFDTPEQLRNYQLGLNKYGDPINVCTWNFGNGSSLPDCGSINPQFMYSGSPDLNTGWLNTTPLDQRYMLTAGPFRMEKNKPVTLLVSYVIGRGNTPVASVGKVKEVTDFAYHIYNSNFTDYTTSIEENTAIIPAEFSLSQNYPNPFNPETSIRFAIPAAGLVKLNIYNILGQKVRSLTNEVLQAGEHTITFNAAEFSSGIYFYRAEWNGTSITRKMTLLK